MLLNCLSQNVMLKMSLSSPLILQEGGNLNTRPSENAIPCPENVLQSVKMDKETGFETLELEQQKGLE